MDGADGERVWEAVVGREGFLEDTGGGHKKPQSKAMVVGHHGHRGFDHVRVLFCCCLGQKIML